MKILITGAGQGLGCWLTLLALQRGHEVFAAVHSFHHSSSQLTECRDKYGGNIHVMEMDVGEEVSVTKAAEQVGKYGSGLDAIINNAGIMLEREKTIEELELSAVTRSFEINTIGPMRVVQKFLPYLRQGNKQVIVNISSEAGTIINAFSTNYPYSMSKTALNMFTERVREYLRKEDIHVYAIHPGWMRTNMGGCDAPANPADIATGILDILERKKEIYSKISFIDSTGRPMPL